MRREQLGETNGEMETNKKKPTNSNLFNTGNVRVTSFKAPVDEDRKLFNRFKEY
jgi:hypothetical protein